MGKKFISAFCGLVAGLCTAPLALIAWPVFLAWFLANEEEG